MSISLYTLHATPVQGEYIIQKFDTDYVCESVYACSRTSCMCPQGHRERCRHRTMLPMFLKHGHVGDGWFLEWDTRMWRRPVNDVLTAPPEGITMVGLDNPHNLHNAIAHAIGENLLADDTLMGTPTGAGGLLPPLAPGAEAGTLGPLASMPASPPSPPEGHSLSRAAEATEPARPVGVGIVKRRKIP